MAGLEQEEEVSRETSDEQSSWDGRQSGAGRTDGGEDAHDASVYESSEATEFYTRERAHKGLRAQEEYVLDEYFERAGASVLDVGCGTGRTTKPIAERGFDVVGVDLSEAMVETASSLHPDVDFCVDDATDLSFDANSFDYVLFPDCGIDCLQPESDRVAALREMHRVLRPDGTAVFSSHNALYLVPALVSDSEHVRTYYLENGNLDRLGSYYKCNPDEFDIDLYWGTPWRTRSQLEAAGFDLVELVTKRDNPLRYLESAQGFVVEPRDGT